MVSGTTRTVGRLAGKWPEHLGVLLTPASGNVAVAAGLPVCCDNSAFSQFDEAAFLRMVDRVRSLGVLWITSPDVVGDAIATLALWSEWRDRLPGLPLAFVGQDGQENWELPDDAQAFFIGGSTEWKLSAAAADLAAEAKRRGWWLHMGRVNSLRRMRHAHGLGCDSIDGSSASMFGDVYVDRYCRWLCDLEAERRLF